MIHWIKSRLSNSIFGPTRDACLSCLAAFQVDRRRRKRKRRRKKWILFKMFVYYASNQTAWLLMRFKEWIKTCWLIRRQWTHCKWSLSGFWFEVSIPHLYAWLHLLYIRKNKSYIVHTHTHADITINSSGKVKFKFLVNRKKILDFTDWFGSFQFQ